VWSVAGFGGRVPASRSRMRGQLRGQHLGLIRGREQPQNLPIKGGDGDHHGTLVVMADGHVADHHRPLSSLSLLMIVALLWWLGPARPFP
jgi:hypothetical protein